MTPKAPRGDASSPSVWLALGAEARQIELLVRAPVEGPQLREGRIEAQLDKGRVEAVALCLLQYSIIQHLWCGMVSIASCTTRCVHRIMYIALYTPHLVNGMV